MSKKADQAIEQRKQKLTAQLLKKRVSQAARAQANLERALEMSRSSSSDSSSRDAADDDLEIDDADLYDIDLDDIDFDDDDDLDYDDADLLESRIEELEESVTDDDMELLESRMDDMDEMLESARHRIDLDEGAPPARKRGPAPPRVASALDQLAQDLRQTVARGGGGSASKAALELLDQLSGQLMERAEPRSHDSLRELLRSYLDLARVVAAAGAALAVAIEEKLGEDEPDS